MNELLALIGFSFVSSITPGPNNLLLWTSGTTFGLRRTARHIAGSAVGLGLMALAVAAGLGAIITGAPQVAFVMKLAGSGYLLYLAWRMAGLHAIARATMPRPMGILSATAFQLVNPKAWIFALGAITTFRPTSVPPALGSVLVAVTMMTVIVPSATVWAAGGDALQRLIATERARRIVSLILAVLLVATVASVWI